MKTSVYLTRAREVTAYNSTTATRIQGEKDAKGEQKARASEVKKVLKVSGFSIDVEPLIFSQLLVLLTSNLTLSREESKVIWRQKEPKAKKDMESLRLKYVSTSSTSRRV